MGRLIVLSGPSCVGKGPLHTAFGNFYPEQAAKLQKLVLYNCRSPRPGEMDGKDYYFRSREEIEKLREKENFIVLDVRGDLQAVDLKVDSRTSLSLQRVEKIPYRFPTTALAVVDRLHH